MKNEKILILYRDGNYKWKKLKKLTKDDMDKKNVNYLLIPSATNSILFYTILPDKRLLSDRFRVKLTMDIANIDFDDDYFTFIDRFDSEYDTDSLIEFIEFISILYKINGVSELIEESWFIDGFSNVRTMYPTMYRIEFYNYNKITDVIDSGDLPNYTYDTKLPFSAFQWLISNRMDTISDILLTWDSSKNSILKIPVLLTFIDGKYNKIKYANKFDISELSSDVMIMVRLDGYGSYYLTNPKMYKILTHQNTFNMDLIVTNINSYDISSNIYRDIGENFESASQIERDAFCRYVKGDGGYLYGHTYSLGDIYSFIIWLTFSKDTIAYIHALFHTVEDKQFVICIRHLGKMINYTFSESDIMHGVFERYLSKYIFGGKM